MPHPRIIKSHECFEPRYPRAMYIVRDPRDVVISQYHYHRKCNKIEDGYPMDKFLSIWWPGEDDARGAGSGAKGFKELNWHAVGANFPAIQDIQKTVVDKGLSKSPKEKVGELLYNRGVYNSMLIAEAIRTAQQVSGKKIVTGEDVRRGLEDLNLDAARLKELYAQLDLGTFESSMRRSMVMSDHFIAPGTLRMIILPSLVASLYSMVSVSDSIPEHLRKLPISTLSTSSTKMKLGVKSGMFPYSIHSAVAAPPCH